MADKLIDQALIRLFPKAFLRFADRHLNRAYERREIDSRTLHVLDNRFKFGLGRGYTNPDRRRG